MRISRLSQLSVPEHLNVLIHSLASSLTWASFRSGCRAHFSRRGWTFQWRFWVLSMWLIMRPFEPRETFLFQLSTLLQKTGVRLSGSGRRCSGFQIIDLATVRREGGDRCGGRQILFRSRDSAGEISLEACLFVIFIFFG